ncbi:MAG TPA: TlpA disulfide reductase family protein [Gemmataceae bacterium]|nr:TlpA disulfide reductase family protein [Gemmataceae bacterium]
MPHLVQMQSKYGKEGFQAVTVNLDGPDLKPKVEKFLRDKKIDVLNLMLKEDPKVIEQRLHIEGLPLVYVFDREGVREKKYPDGVEDEELEKLVEQLLKKK